MDEAGKPGEEHLDPWEFGWISQEVRQETGVCVDMLWLCLKAQSSEAETKECGIIHKPETISNIKTEHRALLNFPLIIRYQL